MKIREQELAGAAETRALKRRAQEAKRKRAAELAAKGYTPKEISVLLGVGQTAIAKWLRRQGVRYSTNRAYGALALL